MCPIRSPTVQAAPGDGRARSAGPAWVTRATVPRTTRASRSTMSWPVMLSVVIETHLLRILYVYAYDQIQLIIGKLLSFRHDDCVPRRPTRPGRDVRAAGPGAGRARGAGLAGARHLDVGLRRADRAGRAAGAHPGGAGAGHQRGQEPHHRRAG